MTKFGVKLHNNCNIFFDYKGCKLSVIRSGAWLKKAHQLRAEVFCKELMWVGSVNQSDEVDEFDSYVHHLGVLSPHDELIAYLRVHPPGVPWMSDSVFSDYLPHNETIRSANTCEVSRLAVRNSYRRGHSDKNSMAASFIYPLLYAYCRAMRTEKVCMIVSKPVLRALQCYGLPCRMPRITCSSATTNAKDRPLFARLDWRDFIKSERWCSKRWHGSYMEVESAMHRSIKDASISVVEDAEDRFTLGGSRKPFPDVSKVSRAEVLERM